MDNVTGSAQELAHQVSQIIAMRIPNNYIHPHSDMHSV